MKSKICSLPLSLRKRILKAEQARREEAESLFTWSSRNIKLKTGNLDFSRHLYLKEPYNDLHAYQVRLKASQMGASVEAECRVIWACGVKGMKVIYFFPTAGDVIEFSQDRFGEIQENSPAIRKLLKPPDKVTLKNIGPGTLYFRGLFHSQKTQGKSGSKVKSVDADFIVFDELDEAMPKQKEAARHRVDHSIWKWVMELSTPTIPDYGIDIEWKRSDQRYWTVKCPHCGTWNCLEKEFPRCLVRIDLETVIRACKKCRKDISGALNDPNSCEWVADYPSIQKRRGYHYSQLFSMYIDPNDILFDFEDPNIDMGLFYNHRLGLPYLDIQNRLQVEEVLACCREYESPGMGYRGCMGVDVGKREFHCFITVPHESGKRKTVFVGAVPVSTDPGADSFEDLKPLMNRFDVDCCVIDAQPETHAARKFATKFKGRVYLCHYSDNQKDELIWTETDEDGVGRVTANRTESLDATFRQIRRQDLLLPRRSSELERFARHCYNLVRVAVKKEETGEIKYRYIRTGDDHQAHARNYCRMAEVKIPPKPSEIVVIKKRNY